MSKVLIKTETISSEIFKPLWMVDIQIKLSSDDIELESDIALTIIFSPKNITLNRKLIINKSIRNDLKICVRVAIKQIPLCLLFSLNSNYINTIFSKVWIILMKHHSIGKIWFNLEFLVVYFCLFSHQHFLQLTCCCSVHVNVCLTML